MRPQIYPVVSPDAISPVRAEAEFKNASKLADFYLHASAVHGYHNFVRAVIEVTWICEFKHATKFYLGVMASDLLDHLQLHCVGLRVLDTVDLQVDMRLYYVKVTGIPEYINMLKEDHKKATCAGLSISN